MMPLNRLSNFELLRIICVLMIVAGHVIMVHGSTTFGSFDWIVDVTLRPWFMCAVNAFILISGYFGIHLSARKMLKMNDMVTFYSVVLFFVAYIWGGHLLDIKKDFSLFFPVLTKKYWYVTVYFALCLLSPALNFFAEKADRPFFKRMIWMSVCLFIVVPTLGYLFNYKAICEDAGYGIVNFCLLYLIGRYLKMYEVIAYFPRIVYLSTYVGCMLLCGSFQYFFSILLGFSFTSFISYNTIFVFVGSLSLFAFFSTLKMGEVRLINWLSSFCLCCYVIHLHPLTFKYFFCELMNIPKLSGFSYIISILLLPIGVFFICVLMESIRRFVFKLLPFYR